MSGIVLRKRGIGVGERSLLEVVEIDPLNAQGRPLYTAGGWSKDVDAVLAALQHNVDDDAASLHLSGDKEDEVVETVGLGVHRLLAAPPLCASNRWHNAAREHAMKRSPQTRSRHPRQQRYIGRVLQPSVEASAQDHPASDSRAFEEGPLVFVCAHAQSQRQRVRAAVAAPMCIDDGRREEWLRWGQRVCPASASVHTVYAAKASIDFVRIFLLCAALSACRLPLSRRRCPLPPAPRPACLSCRRCPGS